MENQSERAVTLVKCLFTIDDVVDSVKYAGQDLTGAIQGNLSDWRSEKNVVFKQVPGAYLVITGHNLDHEWEDSCTSGGFQIKCSNGMTGASDWESVGASYPIEPLHAAGGGSGWSPPCASTSSFFLDQDPSSTKISRREKYYAFRVTTDVTCKFTIDDVVDSVYYDGQDITGSLKGNKTKWDAEKQVSFMEVRGAYLTITGHEPDRSEDDDCSGGLQISCSNGLAGGSGWEVLGSNWSLGERVTSAGSNIWGRPCISTSGFRVNEHIDSTKISAPERYFAFRVRAEVVCSFTIDDVLTSVFYNGNNITDIVTGDKRDKTTEKTVAFTPAPGAYLVFSGHDVQDSNNCASSGLIIQCSNGITSSSGNWTAFSSSEPISQPYVSGGGDGWQMPCTSTSDFSLVNASNSVRKLGAPNKYYAFRFEINYAEKYAQLEQTPEVPRTGLNIGHVLYVATAVGVLGFCAWAKLRRRVRSITLHEEIMRIAD